MKARSLTSGSHWAVRVGNAGQVGRSLCIGTDGNIWLGTYYDRRYLQEIEASDGAFLAGPISICPDTPYGCLVDGNGILWSASLGSYLGELDTNAPAIVAVHNHGAYGSDYGIALGNGRVYQASQSNRTYIEHDPVTNAFSSPACTRGVCISALGIATDGNGDIFVGQTNGANVQVQAGWRLDLVLSIPDRRERNTRCGGGRQRRRLGGSPSYQQHRKIPRIGWRIDLGVFPVGLSRTPIVMPPR